MSISCNHALLGPSAQRWHGFILFTGWAPVHGAVVASLFSSFICGSTFPWFCLVFYLGLWHKDGWVSRVFSRMVFSGYRPRTGIPRACGSIVFWFLKNLYTFSTEWLFPVYTWTSSAVGFSFCVFSSVFCVVTFWWLVWWVASLSL